MSKPENPTLFENQTDGFWNTDVTLLDLFAAKAPVPDGLFASMVKLSTDEKDLASHVAEWKYSVAIAMLAERARREEGEGGS